MPHPSVIDPVFTEIAKAIYGDIDVRELAKFSPGSSDVHIDGPMTPEQARREKKVAQVGLAATGVATVGAGHAITASRTEHLHRMATAGSEKAKVNLAARQAKTEARSAKRVARVATAKGPAGKVLRAVARNPRQAAMAAGVGWGALHGVELAGDVINLRAQGKAWQQANAAGANKPVSKAFRLRPVAEAVLHPAVVVPTAIGATYAAVKRKRSVKKSFRTRPLNVIVDRIPSLRAKRVRRSPMPANPRTQGGIYKGIFPKLKKLPKLTGNAALEAGEARHAAQVTLRSGPNPNRMRSPKWYAEALGLPLPKPLVSKGVRAVYRGTSLALRNVRDASTRGEEAATSAAQAAAKVKRLIPKPRTAALIGGGTVAALTGATYAGTRAGAYAGSYAGSRHGARKKIVPVVVEPVKKSIEDVTWTGVIAKVDADKRQVFGWASVSAINGEDIVDLQGDIVPIDEVEKSAYRYVIESRRGGDMHKRVSKLDEPMHTADMIESFVVTPEKLEKMGLPADALPHGWWVGYHVNDDAQWAMVKSGERKGFSIHGTGKRTLVSKAGLHRLGPLPVDEILGGGAHRAAPRAKLDLLKVPMHNTGKRPLTDKARLSLHRYAGQITTGSRMLAHRDPAMLFKAADQRISKSLREDLRSERRLKLRERADQAINPPAVKRQGVASSAITSMGYQPQTRRLAVEMRSRPGQPYLYKLKRAEAEAAMAAPSLGRHYATQIRGKTERPKRYTVADRARLFVDPQED